MTAPSRYKDWSPAAIFGGNSNDARVHPRGHLGGQSSAPRSPGAQAAALASAWRGRGGDRGDGLLSALAEMNGIISDGVAEEEDRVAPADWRTRAKQHEKPRKAKPRRRPPAPTRSPDLASRQRQRQEQRMRAVHTIQRGWRARCVVDRTARQRPEAIRRRQWGAVELDAVLQIQDAWRDRKRWLAGADARAAKTAARLLRIASRDARVKAAVALECAWRRKMAYELAGEAMWQLRQRKHQAATVVEDAWRRKAAHNALRRQLCWRRAAATLLAAHERGRSSRRAFGAARGASTRLAALSRRQAAVAQFRKAVAAALLLQCAARRRSGRRIGLYRAALRESVAVGIRRMEAIAEAMSAASDAAAAARRASELAAAAAKKAFTESALFTAAMVVQDRRRDAAAQRIQRAARRWAARRRGAAAQTIVAFAEVAAARRREAARRRLACATLAPHFLALLARRRRERLARAKKRVKAGYTLTRLGRGFAGRRAARRRWEIVRRKFTCRNCGRAEPNGNYCKGCGYRRPSLEGEAKPVGTGAAVPIRRPRATSAETRRPAAKQRQLRSGSAGHRDPADALRAARRALAPKKPDRLRSVVRDARKKRNPHCRPLL
jgi:hypothetical protein